MFNVDTVCQRQAYPAKDSQFTPHKAHISLLDLRRLSHHDNLAPTPLWEIIAVVDSRGGGVDGPDSWRKQDCSLKQQIKQEIAPLLKKKPRNKPLNNNTNNNSNNPTQQIVQFSGWL